MSTLPRQGLNARQAETVEKLLKICGAWDEFKGTAKAEAKA